MQFRPATREDVPRIVELLADDILGKGREARSSELTPYFQAFDAMQDEPGNTVLVAESDGKVVGCLQLTLISGLSLSASRRAQIEAVRVATEARGMGIGERLIEFAIERARAEGCSLVQLTSNKVREDAARFYERLGFQPTHIGYKLPL